ncbi:MAG: hypothetical protein N3E44_06290, partial [Candidatus Bathyarchaeota archaeon]|nr:hypothetical protein [Candidatus Bathyarchaeota archaeon]
YCMKTVIKAVKIAPITYAVGRTTISTGFPDIPKDIQSYEKYIKFLGMDNYYLDLDTATGIFMVSSRLTISYR